MPRAISYARGINSGDCSQFGAKPGIARPSCENGLHPSGHTHAGSKRQKAGSGMYWGAEVPALRMVSNGRPSRLFAMRARRSIAQAKRIAGGVGQRKIVAEEEVK